MEIDYEKIEEAIAGDNTALSTAFSWHETPQGYSYWWKQRHSQKPIDIEALKAMRKAPSIQVGEVYTDQSGNHRECIFVDGNNAYMRHKNGNIDAAYIWDVSTGKSICFGWGYHINLTPKPVVNIVDMQMCYKGSYPPHVADHMSNPTHSITFNTIDGEPDTASIKMDKL